MNNHARWEKYFHLGTYDTLLWLSHEGFHALEQSKWSKPESDDIANKEREEYLEDLIKN